MNLETNVDCERGRPRTKGRPVLGGFYQRYRGSIIAQRKADVRSLKPELVSGPKEGLQEVRLVGDDSDDEIDRRGAKQR